MLPENKRAKIFQIVIVLYWGQRSVLKNQKLAETEGFEPSVPGKVRTLSRGVVSANSPTSPYLFVGEIIVKLP